MENLPKSVFLSQNFFHAMNQNNTTILCSLFLLLTFGAIKADAQECEIAFWKEDFGFGQPLIGPPSPNVDPDYAFNNFGVGPGNYSILNNFFHHSSWHPVPEDHTPNDVNGYFMVIDGLASEPKFYEVTLTGVTPNRDYRFAGWAMNIDKPAFQSNLTFKFSIADAAGFEIAQTTTGIMPATTDPVWTEHLLDFNSGTNTELTLSIIFTSTGYDDFAFDDFRLTEIDTALTSKVEKNLCQGDTIMAGGQIFDVGRPKGTVTLFGAAANGCDSIVTVDLTFFDTPKSTFTQALCEGETVTIGSQIFDKDKPTGTVVYPAVTPNGCDSLVEVSLTFYDTPKTTFNPTLCSNETFVVGTQLFDKNNPTGTVVFPAATVHGCDSIVEVSLTYYEAPKITLTQTLCKEETLDLGDETFSFDNPSGTVIFPGAAANGCDSIVEVDLSFYFTPQSFTTQTLCEGETLELGGQIFGVGNPNGTAVFPGATANGCDSIVIVNLTFFDTPLTSVSQTLCTGETLTVGGQTFGESNPTGSAVFPNATANGCDSVVTVSLTFLNTPQTMLSQTLCEGETLAVGGQVFGENNPSGTVTLPNATSNGCDSIVTVTLAFFDTPQSTFSQNLCNKATVAIGGQIFGANNPTGSVVFPAATPNGCDSIVEVNLTFYDVIEIDIDQSLCQGDTFFFQGQIFDQYNPNGEILAPSTTDCDTLFTINVAFSSPSTYIIDTILLYGQTYAVGGQVFSVNRPSGQILLVGAAANGCDSLIIVQIEFVSNAVAFPNVFSPDKDGLNDMFLPSCAPGVTRVVNLEVYGRWGEHIFSAKDLTPNDERTGWDGTFRNKMVDLGVYVYTSKIEFLDGSIQGFSGDVTVVR